MAKGGRNFKWRRVDWALLRCGGFEDFVDLIDLFDLIDLIDLIDGVGLLRRGNRRCWVVGLGLVL
jgi:hypothetical protein